MIWGNYLRNRDSSVGIEIGYVLDDRGWIPGRGKIFLLTESSPTLGSIQPLIKWVKEPLSPGGEFAGA
jgi:hypothetical protein